MRRQPARRHRRGPSLARRCFLLRCPPCGAVASGCLLPGRSHKLCRMRQGLQTSALTNRHQRIHSSAKTYACLLCEKTFKGCSGLLPHQRTHTTKWSYNFPECGKAFCGCSELRQHERLHSGEKPYICHDCGKAFEQLLPRLLLAHAHRQVALCVVPNAAVPSVSAPTSMSTRIGTTPCPDPGGCSCVRGCERGALGGHGLRTQPDVGCT